MDMRRMNTFGIQFIITLSNGVPIESVSKMLGHTSIGTTEIYAKVVEHKLSEDMHDLKIKMASSPR